MSESIWDPVEGLEDLKTPVMEEEIKKVIWELGALKFLDPDYFPLLFYRVFWEDTKCNLSNLLLDLTKGSAQLGRINCSLVTLIPKKDTPEKLGDYRPITLLNSSLKIVSKILANRLMPQLEDLVRKYQSGFIKSRNILEVVALAKEAKH